MTNTVSLTDRTLSVVLLYDYCLTFIQEIELFWMSAWTGAAVLFFMNRYIPLVSVVVNSTRFGITGSVRRLMP